jgi:streptomycin 6-kinase
MIPRSFLDKAEVQFGAKGPEWVASLPSLIEHCIRRWRLVDVRPVEDLSINLVCYATSSAFGPVVLKMQGPHPDRFTEMQALQLFSDDLACRCLECDFQRAVMLLERLVPGRTLRSAAAPPKQLQEGIELAASLPVPAPKDSAFPSYEDWLRSAFTKVRKNYRPSRRMLELMDAAWELYAGVDDGQRFLLHGDLHHDNILSAGDKGWKIIDPQGVIATPLFECGRFIENHVIDDSGLDRALADEAVAAFAAAYHRPARDVAAAFFVLHVLSTCWGFDMGYSEDQLARQETECAEILEILEP